MLSWFKQEINVAQFAPFVMLEYLDLNENAFKRFTASWLDGLINLKVFCVHVLASGNRVAILIVLSLTCVACGQTLGLEGNSMKEIKGQFNLPRLQSLWLGGNRLPDLAAITTACELVADHIVYGVLFLLLLWW